MLFILETFFIFLVSIRLATFFSAMILMMIFHVKRYVLGMDNEKWQKYFRSLGQKGVLIRMNCCFFAVLLIVDIMDTFIFWHHAWVYSVALLIAGIFHIIYQQHIQKKNNFSGFLH